MNIVDSLRLSRFDVIFQSVNVRGETIKCHFITNALNAFDAAFIFGQNNKGASYVILNVEEVTIY